MSALEDAMEGRVRQVPFESVQAMDVILRHLPSLKYAIIGFFKHFGGKRMIGGVFFITSSLYCYVFKFIELN